MLGDPVNQLHEMTMDVCPERPDCTDATCVCGWFGHYSTREEANEYTLRHEEWAKRQTSMERFMS